jgi:hypothetical protein
MGLRNDLSLQLFVMLMSNKVKQRASMDIMLRPEVLVAKDLCPVVRNIGCYGAS